LFAIINPIVRFLLRSPIHRFWSGSLMLITFTGRKSGKSFTTPVRYVCVGDAVRCFSSSQGLWWRNLVGGAEVVLRLRGCDQTHLASVLRDDPEQIREALSHYLALFPQDAAYHDIRLNKDKSPLASDLEHAMRNSVVVEARPV
jgi:hypothetical protein